MLESVHEARIVVAQLHEQISPNSDAEDFAPIRDDTASYAILNRRIWPKSDERVCCC